MSPSPSQAGIVARSIVLAALLALPCVASAAEPIAWEWAPGDSSRYVMTQSMTMSMNAGPAGAVESKTTQAMIMGWTADEVDAESAATLRQKTERIVMKTNGPMGQGFQYDSASDDAPVGMAAMVAPMFDALVSADFTLVMLPTGEITKVELSPELGEAFDKLPGGAMSAKMIEQMTKQGSLRFPERTVEVGEEWTNEAVIDTPQIGAMKVETTYKYLGPKEDGGRTLDAFSASVKITPPEAKNAAVATTIESKDSSGEILFDRDKGRVVRSTIRQLMEISVSVNGQKIVNTIDQTVEMRGLADDESPDLAEIAGLVEEVEEIKPTTTGPEPKQPATPKAPSKAKVPAKAL
ncbi:MAG: DUF6263 family protein [Lacipirellulaceae bacterium]